MRRILMFTWCRKCVKSIAVPCDCSNIVVVNMALKNKRYLKELKDSLTL